MTWDAETLVNRVIIAIGESEDEPTGLRAAIILKAIEDVTGITLMPPGHGDFTEE